MYPSSDPVLRFLKLYDRPPPTQHPPMNTEQLLAAMSLHQRINEQEVVARCLYTINRSWTVSAESPGKYVKVFPGTLDCGSPSRCLLTRASLGTALVISPPVVKQDMHQEFERDLCEALNYAKRYDELRPAQRNALVNGQLTFGQRCFHLIKLHYDWKLPVWVPTSRDIHAPRLVLAYRGNIIESDPTTYRFYDELRHIADSLIESILGSPSGSDEGAGGQGISVRLGRGEDLSQIL